MPQVINTNLASLNAQRNLNMSQSALSTSLQRLSSGLRVNSAKDDAAGLAIAERMNAQVKGMNVAIRNANDAISLSQTAEGALGKVGDMLQRMRELAVQSANATNGSGDRANLQAEYSQLGAEINRTLGGTAFNGTTLFTAGTAMVFQVGAGTTTNDTISVSRTQLTGGTASGATGAALVTALGTASAADKVATTAGINISTSAATATDAINAIDSTLDAITSQRANFGAVQNRFESVIGNLQVSVENQEAARSRIMDADFAAETANMTRNQILQQAGTAMLAQANALPNGVLALLRG
jgi:flagellin